MVDANHTRQVDASEFPALGTMDEKLHFLLRYAVLAPSSHNSQPWRFGLGNGYVELHADRRRALPVVDPEHRELVISCGAALYHLRLAARRFGYTPEVELFPRGAHSDHLATLRLGGPWPVGHEERALCDAILRRHTSRHAFADAELPDELLFALERAVIEEGAWMRVIVGEPKHRLAMLVAEADRRQHHDPGFRAELASWMTSNHSVRGDGMPGYTAGHGDLAAAIGPLLVRTFDVGRGRAASDRELADHSALLVVIGTARDDRPAWLVAGQAMARLLLRATESGVSASFLNQPIELPDMRARIERAFCPSGSAQMILRLGYGPESVPATPRRPLRDVIL